MEEVGRAKNVAQDENVARVSGDAENKMRADGLGSVEPRAGEAPKARRLSLGTFSGKDRSNTLRAAGGDGCEEEEEALNLLERGEATPRPSGAKQVLASSASEATRATAPEALDLDVQESEDSGPATPKSAPSTPHLTDVDEFHDALSDLGAPDEASERPETSSQQDPDQLNATESLEPTMGDAFPGELDNEDTEPEVGAGEPECKTGGDTFWCEDGCAETADQSGSQDTCDGGLGEFEAKDGEDVEGIHIDTADTVLSILRESGKSDDGCVTTQRFAVHLEGRPYMARILVDLARGPRVEFFDVGMGQVVAEQIMPAAWLNKMAPELRHQVLACDTWVRDRAAMFFGGPARMPLHKPNRPPPPVPQDEAARDAIEALAETLGSCSPSSSASTHRLEEALRARDLRIEALERALAGANAAREAPAASVAAQTVEQASAERSTTHAGAQTEDDGSTADLQAAAQAAQEALRRATAELDELRNSSSGEAAETQLARLKEAHEAEMNEMRIKLMDAEADMERHVKAAIKTERDQIEQAMGEIEAVAREFAEANETLKRDLESTRSSNVELRARVDHLEEHVSVLRTRQEESEKAAGEARTESDAQRQEIARLERVVNEEFPRELERHEAEAQREKTSLMDKLEVMTKSRDELKAHVDEVKAQFFGMRDRLQPAFRDMQEAKTQLELDNAALAEELAVVKEHFESASVELENVKSELASAQDELAKEGHARSTIEKDFDDLAVELGDLRVKHATVEEEHRLLLTARKTALLDYENERSEQRRAHEQEISKLKVSIFDAKAALETKETENSELVAYVTQLLDEQGSLQSKLCPNCAPLLAGSGQ